MARNQAPGPQSAQCPLWVISGHSGDVRATSALAPKAANDWRLRNARYVPATEL